jgi:leader peptidase (prepilin peptidase) / N-methyltransferase
MQLLLIIILGLALGSFLFAMSIRLQAEESVWTRSHCPQCNKPISPLGLIPVLGYAIYRGKCPSCDVKIPLIYPLAELGNAALTMAIFWKTGWSVDFLHYFIVFEAFLLIAIIDLRCYLIFHQPIIFALIAQSCWLYFYGVKEEIIGCVIGLVSGAGLFHWISYLYQTIRNKIGLGEGDATLLGLIGFCFGWRALFPVIFWSSTLALIAAALFFLIKKRSFSSRIAFGPWLVMASFLIWLFPDFFRSFPVQFY